MIRCYTRRRERRQLVDSFAWPALIDMKERMNPELQQTSDTMMASVKRPAEQNESTRPSEHYEPSK